MEFVTNNDDLLWKKRFLTRKEIAELCKSSVSKIQVDIKRGKLPKVRKFDLEIDFIREYVMKSIDKLPTPVISERKLSNVVKKEDELIAIEAKVVENIENDVGTVTTDLKNEKTIADIENRKQSTILVKKKIRQMDLVHERLTGRLSPTEFSIEVMRRHIKYMGMLYKQSMENIVDEIIADAGLGVEKRVEYITNIHEAFNEVADTSENEAVKDLQIYIDEYIEKIKLIK